MHGQCPWSHPSGPHGVPPRRLHMTVQRAPSRFAVFVLAKMPDSTFSSLNSLDGHVSTVWTIPSNNAPTQGGPPRRVAFGGEQNTARLSSNEKTGWLTAKENEGQVWDAAHCTCAQMVVCGSQYGALWSCARLVVHHNRVLARPHFDQAHSLFLSLP